MVVVAREKKTGSCSNKAFGRDFAPIEAENGVRRQVRVEAPFCGCFKGLES